MKEYLNGRKLDYRFINKFQVVITTEESEIPAVIFGVKEKNIWITDIEVKKPTLEDFFLTIARGGNDVA